MGSHQIFTKRTIRANSSITRQYPRSTSRRSMPWPTRSCSPTSAPSSSTGATHREQRHFTERLWLPIQTFWLQKTGETTCFSLHLSPFLECFYPFLPFRLKIYNAQSRLENLAASLLPRWHFPMLNDTERNSRFEAVREGGHLGP